MHRHRKLPDLYRVRIKLYTTLRSVVEIRRFFMPKFNFRRNETNMKTSIFRRGISGLLAVLMTFTALMGIGTTTAFAASTAGETAESYSVGFPRDGDANLDYSGTWGHDELHYMNGWTSGEATWMTTLHTIGSFDGQACYCIRRRTIPMPISRQSRKNSIASMMISAKNMGLSAQEPTIRLSIPTAPTACLPRWRCWMMRATSSARQICSPNEPSSRR